MSSHRDFPAVHEGGSLWVVVLAGGEGRRLRSLTRALYGLDLPKQFAVIDGDHSLLQSTVLRALELVPEERIVVVVGESAENLAREQLAAFPSLDVAVQPRNLDTGPGILFPLSRILAREPSARILILPSDHFLPNPLPFLTAAQEAAEACKGEDPTLLLLGAEPTHPETEYGWIVPATAPPDGNPQASRGVAEFVEKPPPDAARRLLEEGGLWNMFVIAGRLETFWRLARTHLPEHIEFFEAYARLVGTPLERWVLHTIYDAMKPSNFSVSVLEKAASLAVLPVRGSGWSDWGSPERVYQSLRESGRIERLRARISAASTPVEEPLLLAVET